VVRSRGGVIFLVVGEEIGVDKIQDLLGKNLVGKFIGQRIGVEKILTWVFYSWFLALAYSPTIHFLSQGWVGFIFKSV
jgi:hypothetical protein